MKKIIGMMLMLAILCMGCGKENSDQLPEHITMEEAKKLDMVVIDHQKDPVEFVNGEEQWKEFLQQTSEKQPASITIADFYEDSSVKRLEYDGSQYKVSWREQGKVETREYPFLIEREGKYKNAAATTHGFYLTHVEGLTYDELFYSMISSQMEDCIDFFTIYSESVQ